MKSLSGRTVGNVHMDQGNLPVMSPSRVLQAWLCASRSLDTLIHLFSLTMGLFLSSGLLDIFRPVCWSSSPITIPSLVLLVPNRIFIPQAQLWASL